MAAEVQAQPNHVQDGDVEQVNGNISGEELPSEMNGQCFENGDVDDDSIRIIRKAKRHTRKSPTKEAGNATAAGTAVQNNHKKLPLSKNSRRSRNGKGRGLPKKGGAGGKGVWGKPTTDYLSTEAGWKDTHDPNYDSESEDEYIVEKVAPVVTKDELQKVLEPLVLEYYEHGDSQEVVNGLEDLNLGPRKPFIVQSMLNLAMDRKATHREMTSVLLSDLYGELLHGDDIAHGFDEILGGLKELTLDTPDAPSVVGQFIARAVADDCLPPKYIRDYKGKVDCQLTQHALNKADVLLSQKHGIVRLDNIWGTGGGIRPVKYLVKQILMLLKEYLSSGDIAEATRCLQDLEVPHFHHELVYEATVMVLEDSSERSMERMCKLLKSLCEAVIITPDQMATGFRRVCEEMPDISIDVPNAYSLLERFANICHRENVLTDSLLKDLPQRGRKRFVSEGDGGRVKEVDQ